MGAGSASTSRVTGWARPTWWSAWRQRSASGVIGVRALGRCDLSCPTVLGERVAQPTGDAVAGRHGRDQVGVEIRKPRREVVDRAHRAGEGLRVGQRHVLDHAKLLAVDAEGDVELAVAHHRLRLGRRCVREAESAGDEQRSTQQGAGGGLLHRVHVRSFLPVIRQGSRAARGSPHSPEGGHRPLDGPASYLGQPTRLSTKPRLAEGPPNSNQNLMIRWSHTLGTRPVNSTFDDSVSGRLRHTRRRYTKNSPGASSP